jgi:hypothetical protein
VTTTKKNYFLCHQDDNLSGAELLPVEQRTRQDIEKNYKQFFEEYYYKPTPKNVSLSFVF